MFIPRAKEKERREYSHDLRATVVMLCKVCGTHDERSRTSISSGADCDLSGCDAVSTSDSSVLFVAIPVL